MTYQPVPQLEYYKRPSPFPEEMTARWRQWFAGVPMMIHGEPYSDWIPALYNSDAFEFRLSGREGIVKAEELPEVLLIATGDEGFAAGDVPVTDIVSRLQAYLGTGGTLRIMSGGRYPLFYPGGGAEAEKLGFRLKVVDCPGGSEVTFDAELPGDLDPWVRERASGARLMVEEMYADAKSYHSLARVELASGTYHGDAMAAVEFDPGRLIFVSAGLTDHPDRAAVLDAIFDYVHETALRTR